MSAAQDPTGARVAVALARAVRAAGVPVPADAVILLAEALALVGLADRDAVFRAGRTVCCAGPEHFPAFTAAFDRVLGDGSGREEPVPAVPVVVVTDDEAQPGDPDGGGGAARGIRWSRAEVLRSRDFAEFSDSELAEARRLMAALRPAVATRRSRRFERTRRRTRHPDLRRTASRSLRTGGDPVRGVYRRRAERPRRVVLLLDVSGSMEPYARAYANFLHVAVAGGGAEAFAIGTRLTRITGDLAGRDASRAVAAAARRVVDWSGGTRLGEGVRRFNDDWGIRGPARGAVVVVVSDGWDRGDPALLGTEMARLARVAHRIIWVNPLVATPGFAPVAGGMAAALPHVDALVAGHNLAALETVVAEMAA